MTRTRPRPHDMLLQLALVAALVALAAAHVARGAEEGVTRVRVDLDLEQLGLVGPGAGDRIIELEIHCEGARPNHQIFMDDDVLVVRIEAAPPGADTDHRLGVAAQQGVAISVDLATEFQVVPEAVAEAADTPDRPEAADTPDRPEPEAVTEAADTPDRPETELEIERADTPDRPETELEIEPADTPDRPETELEIERDSIPSPPTEPRLLYDATPADQLGMEAHQTPPQTEFVIDDPDAVEEVMSALTAALDEARAENSERLRESGMVEEYIEETEDGQQTSSWSVERGP